MVTVSSATASAPRTSAAAPSSAPTTGTGPAVLGIGALAERGAQRLEQHVAGLGELAADHHDVGVDEVAQVGRGDAEVVPGVEHDAAAPGVAASARATTSASVRCRGWAGASSRTGAPDQHLEAAAVAAAADGTVLVDGHVPDLAGHPGPAVETRPPSTSPPPTPCETRT